MIGDIIQPTHLLFILVVALLVLGPKRLPEVGRSLGRGIRDFRQGMAGIQDEARGVFHDALDEPSGPPVSTPTATLAEQPAPTVEPVVSSAAEPARVSVAPAPAAVTTRAFSEPDPADYAD